MSYLKKYLSKFPSADASKAVIAYLAGLDCLGEKNQKIQQALIQELKDQRSHLKMIASENYSSLATQLAMGNLFTDKYAEGFVNHRFYAGCDNVDVVEEEAVKQLKELFGADHAYVQPHSGADANMVAFWAVIVQRIQNPALEKLAVKNVNALSDEEYEKIRQLMVNQKIMGMSLNAGGHLTHGYRMNVSSKMMQAIPYDVDPDTHLLDYKAILHKAKKERPLILVAGYSAYPRLINFAKMREIADEVNATLVVDMAHFSGLVAGKVLKGDYNPVPFAQIVTSTTHKTLRGPRGGMILCSKEFKDTIDKGCPLVLGGPLPHIMAAKAVAFKEANTTEFVTYAHQIVSNCKALAKKLMKNGVKLVTDGTENHLLVMDVQQSFGLNGRQAEQILRKAKITVNRNTVPFDSNGAWFTSGVRLGTAALTTRGMNESDMELIADTICHVLGSVKVDEWKNIENKKQEIVIPSDILERVHQTLENLLKKYPLYPELLID